MKTRDENHDLPESSLEPPPALITALNELPQERPFIPPSVDAAVLRAARERLAPAARPWLSWASWRLWLAAGAAGVLLLMPIWLPSTRSMRTPMRQISQDLNGDGRVDILDAFILARKLQSERAEDRRFDFNGDGKADDRDVAALAVRAVKLDKKDRS